MYNNVLTTLAALIFSLSASAYQNQSNPEVFEQMMEQRKANANKVLQSVPKKVLQESDKQVTPFQQMVEDEVLRISQDGEFTSEQEQQNIYDQAVQVVRDKVVKLKDGYRTGEYLQGALCHLSDDGIGCINDESLEGKRPSTAYLPGFFPSNMQWTKNLQNMPTSAQIEASVQPWSDDYWAINKGILGYRYANEEAYIYDWQTGVNYVLSQEGHLSKILNMPDGMEKNIAINTLSPSEKYDLLIGTISEINYSWIQWTDSIEYANGTNLFGKIGGFLTPQQWYQGQGYFDRSGEVEGWMGICHGWAAAAIQMQRPTTAINVMAADGKTQITFYPAEIKALGSYLWANSAPRGSRFIGGRCNDKDVEYDDESGAILDQTCFDTNPADWHAVITNYIGNYKRSFVMDATFDYEVWNQPVLGYEVHFSNPMDESYTTYKDVKQAAIPYADYKKQDVFKNVRNADPKTAYIVNVGMEVQYLVENSPSQNEEDGAEYDNVTETYYSYDLELDANYNVIGGEWHSNEHPDFLWSYDEGQHARARLELNYNDSDLFKNIDAQTISAPMVSPALQKVAQKAAAEGEVLGSIVEALFKAAQ